MTDRMAPTRRLLRLVHLLADSAEGLTLDEMAAALGVKRRTAERMRDVIAGEFELVDAPDGPRRRFRIPDGLRAAFTRPSPAELAALATEAQGLAARIAPNAALLASLRDKLSAMYDDRARARLEPDLEPLARLQRPGLGPHPENRAGPEIVAVIRDAIMAGTTVRFAYRTGGSGAPARPRELVPYGLIHGRLPYFLGLPPGRDDDPALYRLDRMSDVAPGPTVAAPPADWNLDDWLAGSVGVWREPPRPIILYARPDAVEEARGWRFHPRQTLEPTADGGLLIRFTAGGLRGLADHLVEWGGRIVILGPPALAATLRRRLADAQGALGDAPAAVRAQAGLHPRADPPDCAS